MNLILKGENLKTNAETKVVPQHETPVVTARNEVGARLCFYTCLWFCSQGGWVVSQHALQVVSQHALQQVSRRGWYPSMLCRFPGPHPGGEVEVSGQGGLQAHTWVSPDPHLGVSRPTPSRGGLQAHTQGGLQTHTWGVYPSMYWSRPPQSPDGYCCGRYASYWNAFLF